MWVADTASLGRAAEVPLPAPSADAAPTPDGRWLVASNVGTPNPDERTTRLVELPSGRVLASWPGLLVATAVHRRPVGASTAAGTDRPDQP